LEQAADLSVVGEVWVIWNTTVSRGSVGNLEHYSKGSSGYLEQAVYLPVVGEVWVIWNTTVSRGSSGYLEQAVYLPVVGEVWVIWNTTISKIGKCRGNRWFIS
jgi:hypothetical protein